jgi:DNA polymerase III epsilon subunit-like protein
MANTDVMIDLETLATSTDAAILTIGAVKFDPLGDDVKEPAMESFYVRVDLDSCHEIGLVTNDDTIAWWANQSKEAQEEAFGEDNRIPITEAMNQLYKFCWGAKRVWSNGSVFDIMICEHVFKKINKAVPWKFWEIRDVRTAFDLGINPNRPTVTAHHALEDAYNQAVGIQTVYNALRSSTMYDGKMITPFSNQR